MLILLYLVATLFLVAVAGCVLSWILYVPLVVRAFGETPWLVARTYPALNAAEDNDFRTTDGLVLRGSYLRTTASDRLGVIAFCHEFGGDRWGAAPYVADLRQCGFDIFTFDFRNHGASGRLARYRPMPWLSEYELTDVQAAIDYLCSRADADPRGIGLFGVSKGANAALCAAATDTRVRCVVTDGAFPTVSMQHHYMRRFMRIYIQVPLLEKLPDWCLSSFCQWARVLVGLRQNCRFVNIEQVVRTVTQPVFMIHGQRDAYVPPDVAHALRTCLAGRSKFWLVPGVRHNEAVTTLTDEYHRRVTRFFLKTLHGAVNGYMTPIARRIAQEQRFPEQNRVRRPASKTSSPA